ncbi:MAG: YceD family protein [Clostridiales bacterium]|nr:YceD family protein [Clostridiales bacterium]
MKLDVLQALRNPGTEYAFSAEQELAPQEVSGSEITFDPVQLKGKLVAGEDGSVTVEGKLITVAHAQCAKCLAPAISTVEGDFRETFIHGGDPEDDESFAYNGGAIELDKLTLFYVMFNLPMRFLCKEDCPGLGMYAGADVTIGSGEDVLTTLCQDELNVQRPFAALQQLLAEKSDNAEN